MINIMEENVLFLEKNLFLRFLISTSLLDLSFHLYLDMCYFYFVVLITVLKAIPIERISLKDVPIKRISLITE